MNSSASNSSETDNSEHQKIDPHILQRYQLLQKIGSGAYGHVWKVRCRKSKQTFAIKKVFLAFQNEVDAQRVYRQVNLLTRIDHENVVRLKQVLRTDNKNDIYLLFEFMESDLFKAIKNKVLDQMHKKYIVYQLACALKYLHSAAVLHRDLKPSNVLINSKCEVKICDFGLSRSLRSDLFNHPHMTQFIATRWYRSPQVLLGSRVYDEKSDMWSLGCLIYELYSRRTLMPGENTIDQITKMLQFKGRPTPSQILSFKAPKADQILSYFNFDKQSKSYYYDDLQIDQIKGILDKLLEYNPEKRWSAQDLLNSSFLRQYKYSAPQKLATQFIQLDLNDNRRYPIQRYKQALIKNVVVSQPHESPKITKRLFYSQRKNGNSLNGNFLKLLKTNLNSSTYRDTLKTTKKYQSAHVSPGQVTPSRPTRISHHKSKMSEKMIASYMPLQKKSSESLLKSQKNSFLIKKSGRKSQEKQPKPYISQKMGKQQNQNRFKSILKRQKLKNTRLSKPSIQ